MGGDSGDEGAEDERGDDGLDEAEEDVAEDVEVEGEGWGVEAELDAGEHGPEDPDGHVAAADGVDGGEGESCDCGGLLRGCESAGER